MANTPQLRKYTTVHGTSGTGLTQGIIVGEEYNKRLQGHQALQAYDVMSRSDADVHAALEVCKQPIIAASKDIKPATNPNGDIDEQDQKIADQVEHELFHANIDFDDLLYQSLDMLDFGFSLFELALEIHDYQGSSVWGLKELAFRKQTSITKWIQDNGQPGVHQQTLSGQYDIPWDQIVLFTNKRRGDNYTGISLLRYVYKDWDMKDKLTLVNAQALEQLAKGVPVLRPDPDATKIANETDIDKAEEALRNFKASDEGYLKTPLGMLIEMLDMKGNSTKDILPTLAMHKRAIYSSVLATFMDLGGSSGSGSQSLSKDLTSLFLKSEEYIAKTIASVINKQVIKRIVDANYSNLPNGYPELVIGNIGDDDITEIADAVSKFMTAGALTPDAEMEDIIRQKVGVNSMPKELKDSYEERRQQSQQALQQTKEDTTTTKSTDKTKAAVNAARDAQRKIIEVIYQD